MDNIENYPKHQGISNNLTKEILGNFVSPGSSSHTRYFLVGFGYFLLIYGNLFFTVFWLGSSIFLPTP